MATYKHLRSSTANKRPTTSITDGQLAINTNTASPGLFFKDSAGTGIVKVGPVHVGTTAPNATPAAGGGTGNYTGEQWLDTSVSPAQMKVWNGSAWVGIVADELPVSKLQDGAARQLLQTDAAGTGVEWTSNVDVPGTLDVTGATTLDSTLTVPLGSAASPTLRFSGDANSGLYSPGADQVAVATNGSGRLFIGSAGDIGIGAAPSGSYKLEISGTTDTSALFNTTSANGPHLRFAESGTVRHYLGSAPGLTAGGTSSDFAIRSAGYFAVTTNGNNERLRITSAGLVGVGTSAPGAKIDIVSDNNTSLASVLRVNSNNVAVNTSLAYDGLIGSGELFVRTSSASKLYLGTNNTNALTIDTSGNVGIGTTSPNQTLHVNGIIQADSSGNYLQLQQATNDSFINNTGSGGIIFRQGAGFTERARIDSSGNVGIGTSSPSVRLQVTDSIAGGSDNTIATLHNFSDTGGDTRYAGLNFRIGSDNGTSAIRAYRTNTATNYETNLSFWTNPVGATQTPLQAMTIDSYQQVGIGTTSPASILHCASTGDNNIRVVANGATAQLGVDGGAPFVGTNSGPFNFYSNGNISATLDSSGRLLVGTSSASLTNKFLLQGDTSSASNGGYMRLQTTNSILAGTSLGSIGFGDSANNGALIEAKGDVSWSPFTKGSRLEFSTTADGASSPTERMRIESTGRMQHTSSIDSLYLGSTQGAGTSYAFILGVHSRTGPQTGGTNAFLVYTNGNVENTNNSYAGISDLKLKENIVNAGSQWDDLKALQVRKYNFKKETGQQTHTQIGLVAQEVELVSPGLVSESPDRDEDGNDLGTVTKSVNYSVLYMKAVKALQEAMERIETLEGMVAVNNITIDEQQHQLSTLAARLTALESA
jgi:hypothetical protein